MLNLSEIRSISWHWMVVAVIVWPILIVISFRTLSPLAKEIVQVTNGIIQPTLIFSAVLYVVVIIGVIIVAGGLRPADIGLRASMLPSGIISTICVWGALQLIILIASLGTNTGIVLNRAIESNKLTITLGQMFAQVIGNAFVEELMFRGFLMPQLYQKFNRDSKSNKTKKIILAIIVSQLTFALVHIPNLHRLAIPGGDAIQKLLIIFVTGVFFALLYYRTGNIFICIGLHVLINTPVPIFQSVLPPEVVVFILAIVVFFAWPRFPWTIVQRVPKT